MIKFSGKKRDLQFNPFDSQNILSDENNGLDINSSTNKLALL